jgi:hypothetical protein
MHVLTQRDAVEAYISETGYLVIIQKIPMTEDQAVMIAPNDIEEFLLGIQQVVQHGVTE